MSYVFYFLFTLMVKVMSSIARSTSHKNPSELLTGFRKLIIFNDLERDKLSQQSYKTQSGYRRPTFVFPFILSKVLRSF